MWRRRVDDPNDSMLQQLIAGYERLVEAGYTESEALDRANRALVDSIESSVPRFSDNVTRQGLRYVGRIRRYDRGFRRRLRRHWGSALDLLLVIVSMSEDAAIRCHARNRQAMIDDNDVLFDALFRMNGHSCRLAREVHALLAAGYPSGALARTRTLHELSVRAQVLREFGRQSAHPDLAERYVLHDHVVNYKDALVFQQHAERLGYEKFSDAEMDRMSNTRRDLLARFGREFDQLYGWACGLPGVSRSPKFDELERLAGIDHLRGQYKWASHEIHADSKALRMNIRERAGTSATLTNATNDGLAEPGGLAVIYVHQILVAMLYSVTPSHFDLLVGQSMGVLVERASGAFGHGQERVDAAEDRLQARLARRGKRMDPVRGVVSIEAEEPASEQ